MKNYNSDANNKDVITVDYMVTGGRQKDCILRTKNYSVNLTFSFLYPLSPSVMSFITISNLYKSLQTCRSCQKCGVSNRFLTTVCVFIDLDPCIDVTCHYHCLCKAFGALLLTVVHPTKNQSAHQMAQHTRRSKSNPIELNFNRTQSNSIELNRWIEFD